jgi:hypothetical protein
VVLARPIEREDDLSLFFWLVRELERVEARPEAGNHAGADAAERRAREPCCADVAVVPCTRNAHMPRGHDRRVPRHTPTGPIAPRWPS